MVVMRLLNVDRYGYFPFCMGIGRPMDRTKKTAKLDGVITLFALLNVVDLYEPAGQVAPRMFIQF